MVDVVTGAQKWGERYQRKLSDIFALQGEIAKEISEKLRLKLTGAEEAATGEAIHGEPPRFPVLHARTAIFPT